MISLRKFGIGNNGGTFGDEDSDVPNDTPSALMGASGSPSAMKKGGKVKETGIIKMHKGEDVIPPLRGIHIEFHRDGQGKVEGFTVHQHGMPQSASESGAFMKQTKESHDFKADQHEAMMDHVHDHSAGQLS